MRDEKTVLIVSDITITRRRLSRIIEDGSGTRTQSINYQSLEHRIPLDRGTYSSVIADLTNSDENQEEALKRLLQSSLTPVTILQGSSEPHLSRAQRIVELGAVASVGVEKSGANSLLSSSKSQEINRKLKFASRIRVVRPRIDDTSPVVESKGFSFNIANSQYRSRKPELIAIAASTGGPDFIRELLSRLAEVDSVPPILVAQHMHPRFTHVFARELDSKLDLKVTLAEHQESLEQNHVYVSPGDRHMRLGANVRINLTEPTADGHICPSADVLFRSLSTVDASALSCVILSGMGSDGTKGLQAMHEYGATTYAQEPEECIVSAMPQSAINSGCIDHTLSVSQIAFRISHQLRICSRSCISI